MATITSNYDGPNQYLFSARGSSVVMVEYASYNYTGGGAAFLMDVFYGRFLVGGWVFAGEYGIQLTAGIVSSINVAQTGMISANSYAILASGVTGELRVTNHGVIEASTAIYAYGSAGNMIISNFGSILSTVGGGYSIISGGGDDVIVNYGTLSGSIDTGAGNDRIDVHLGTFNGTVSGRAGDDTYVITSGQIVTEYNDEVGIDTVICYGDYNLGGNFENLELAGLGRIGRGNSLDNVITGNELGNVLSGGRGDDQIQAGAGDDALRGGSGNDLLQSTQGSDTLDGGDGNDTLILGIDPSQAIGGAGLDVVLFLQNDTAIAADLSLASNPVTGGYAGLHTLSGIEGVWGGQYDDTLIGSAEANDFFGYVGDDVIDGMDGDDVIEGYAGADTLDGGRGNDTLSYAYAEAAVTVNLATNSTSGGDAAGDVISGFENLRGGLGGDTLIGSSTANTLAGNEGADVLNGGAGYDVLDGGAGDDQLTGGIGRDVFRFTDEITRRTVGTTGFAFGADTITDFQDGMDRISFVGHATVHGLADLTITQVGTSTIIAVAGTTDQITLLNFNASFITGAEFLFG